VHILGQSGRVIDDNLASAGTDALRRRQLTERTRHDLARGAEMGGNLLLGHPDDPVRRRMKEQEVGQTPLEFVRVDAFELHHQPDDDGGERLHGHVAYGGLGLEQCPEHPPRYHRHDDWWILEDVDR
jgi:hypothetical protein